MAENEQKKRIKKQSKQKGPLNEVFEEVNVLVTGFDHSDGESKSAAWLIARNLPSFLPVTPVHPSRIRISVHPTPLPITYDASARFSKEIAASVPNQFHLVLHISASEGLTGYKIERYARRNDYIRKDREGKTPHDIRQLADWKHYEVHAESTAHLVDVCERWRSDFPDEALVPSEDAGHFVCEYLFFASLANTQVTTKREGIQWEHRTTVELLQVPTTCDTANIEKGRDVVVSLIYAIIDSRRQRDGDYDEGAEMEKEKGRQIDGAVIMPEIPN